MRARWIGKRKRYLTVTFSAGSLIGLMLIAFQVLNSAAQNGRGVTDGDRGKQLFEKRCGGCHSLDQDMTGPRLRNVYGRRAGSVSTFRYSDAMKGTQITWNDASLDKWLTDPESMVPDTDMEFHVPKADEREAIIRFLRLSSGK